MVPNVIERVWTQGANTEVENLRGTAFTEEAGAHTFRISGKDAAGEAVALSGSVLAKILRADNVTVDVSGSVSDGVASVTLVGDCYNVPGRFSIVVYLSDGTSTVAIYAAVGNIYRATSGTELDSGTTVPSLQQLEAAYDNAVSGAAAANAAAAAAGNVNIAMSKSGKVITLVTTNSSGVSTSVTLQEPQATVSKSGETVTVTVVDADGTTTAQITDPEIRVRLLADNVPNTTQEYTFGADGAISKVEHKDGTTVERSDVFTFTASAATEVRTLKTGETLTIVTNLETLQTTVTYVAA